jgi:hypothetical protein
MGGPNQMWFWYLHCVLQYMCVCVCVCVCVYWDFSGSIFNFLKCFLQESLSLIYFISLIFSHLHSIYSLPVPIISAPSPTLLLLLYILPPLFHLLSPLSASYPSGISSVFFILCLYCVASYSFFCISIPSCILLPYSALQPPPFIFCLKQLWAQGFKTLVSLWFITMCQAVSLFRCFPCLHTEISLCSVRLLHMQCVHSCCGYGHWAQ